MKGRAGRQARRPGAGEAWRESTSFPITWPARSPPARWWSARPRWSRSWSRTRSTPARPTIQVELEGGGRRRIRVRDDGAGMGRDDALLAFDRHATSKIASFEDLERVATLGFRGEALAAIAAVSRVELLTAEAAGEGHRVRIEGGRVRVAEPAAAPRGTSVEVRSLFFNVPARRAFLKSPATELRRALEVVQGYALARPEVRFTVAHEGHALLEAPAAAADPAGRRERVGADLRRRARVAADRVRRPRGGDRRPGRRCLRPRAAAASSCSSTAAWCATARCWPPSIARCARSGGARTSRPSSCSWSCRPSRWTSTSIRRRPRCGSAIPPSSTACTGELRSALARARGEEPAPVRSLAAPRAVRTARLGGPRRPRAGDGRARSPREPGRLAEAVYAPLERQPVPLVGARRRPARFRLLGQYKGDAHPARRPRRPLSDRSARRPRARALRAPAAGARGGAPGQPGAARAGPPRAGPGRAPAPRGARAGARGPRLRARAALRRHARPRRGAGRPVGERGREAAAGARGAGRRRRRRQPGGAAHSPARRPGSEPGLQGGDQDAPSAVAGGESRRWSASSSPPSSRMPARTAGRSCCR